ncbi:MAG: DUF6496 domain-containing protein [Micropepsaceae bacterium]
MSVSPKQKLKVKRVMHEFKEGDLRSSTGAPVRKRAQAIAIALSESGQSLTDASKRKRARAKTK